MELFGFGNHHSSEAIKGALPLNQNSPQHCQLGLYAEQLSGSAFTKPRHMNFKSWLYRQLPSVAVNDYTEFPKQITQPLNKIQFPNPYRWSPQKSTETLCDFIDGLFHVASTSKVHAYLYSCTLSMEKRYFSNHDAEMLFVPYLGEILLATELGNLTIKPGMIAVIPRGIAFKVKLLQTQAKGYLCENSGEPLALPQLGIMGANGLANPRHFAYPNAAFEAHVEGVTLIHKYQHRLFMSENNPTPLNVVAWHGNYAPYSYNLALFNTINTVSFDHPDPSIFTVLTSESNTPGVANLDFVIFPSRWMVAENTFRPPYFHKNIMSEFMGLIEGTYDAKEEGFLPGGISIHNSMTPHGPDKEAYLNAIEAKLTPERYENTLAFMFETNEPWCITEQAMHHVSRQKNYRDCWRGFTQKSIK